MKKARKCFKEALDNVSKDPELKLNPLYTAALSINAGVADLAAGETKEANAKFERADRMLDDVPGSRNLGGMFAAIDYNLALVKARSKDDGDKRQARQMFEVYLKGQSPDTAWWFLAYQQYAKLGKEIGEKNQPYSSLLRKAGPGACAW